MRKLCVALLAAALLFPVLAASAAAAPLDKPAVTIEAPAAPADCTDASSQNYHGGEYKDIYNIRVYGVKARVDPPSATNQFDVCNGGELVVHKGVFAYVSLEPGFESRWKGTSSIIQIGLAHCDDVWYSDGSGDLCVPGTVKAFYAVAGCGHKSYGVIGNYGTAPRDLRVESVYVNGVTKFRGYIDNDMKFSLEQNHSHIDCWINEDTMATWAGELWDGGDSYGSSGAPSDKLLFGSAAYRSIGGVFVNPGFNATTNCKSGPEDADNSNHVCDVTYNDDFYLYSVPN